MSRPSKLTARNEKLRQRPVGVRHGLLRAGDWPRRAGNVWIRNVLSLCLEVMLSRTPLLLTLKENDEAISFINTRGAAGRQRGLCLRRRL